MQKKYKLDVANHVDVDGWHEDEITYVLNLPYGYRFSDDIVHVRGFDTMIELRMSAKNDVVSCKCPSCVNRK